MTQTHLKRLLQYDQAMTDKVILALDKLDAPNNKMIRLMSHVINAGYVWMDRVEGKKSGIGVWDIHSLEEMARLNLEIHKRIFNLIDSQDEFQRDIEYKNSRGDSYSSNLFDILFQLINHGTHHRGQVVYMIREMDLQPPVTDFIFYIRN